MHNGKVIEQVKLSGTKADIIDLITSKLEYFLLRFHQECSGKIFSRSEEKFG